MTAKPYTCIVIELPDEEGVVHIRRKRSPEGDHASLGFLQGIVGGYIEHLCTPDGKTDFWLNEEGKLDGLPINNVATDILWKWHPVFRGQDVLVGNIVLTGNRGPETADVPAARWDELKGMRWLVPVELVDELAPA